MEKIIDYRVVSAISESDVAKFVKEHIEKGWQPLGGLTTSYGEINTMPGTRNNERKPGFLFSQAVVKY